MGAQDSVFIGRVPELASALAAVEAGSAVVVVGPAGVGKSSLAGRACDVLAELGHPVRRIAGREATRVIPFGAYGDLLGDGPPHLAASAVIEALPAGAGGRQPVLLVDDVHALDDASLGITHQLVHDDRLQVVLTVRSDGPLDGAVGSLCAESRVTRIDLEPLTSTEVGRLVEELAGGPVEFATRRQLADVSGGNPLFIRELFSGSLAAGVFAERDGVWRFNAPLVGTPVLEDIILSRYAALDQTNREVIEAIALAGGLPLAVVEQLVPIALLEALERDGIVVIRDGGDGSYSVDLSHPLHGEIIRRRTPALTRLRLSRLLAHAVDAVPAGTVDELRAALWQRDGGEEPSADRLLAATRLALDRNDTVLAGALAEATLERQPTFDGYAIACWCRAERGDHAGAHALASTAFDALEDPWQRTAMALRMAEERWWAEGIGPADRSGRDLLLDTGRLLPAGPWQETLRAQALIFDVLDGAVHRALVESTPFHERSDPRVSATGSLVRSLALTFEDRAEEAVDLARATRDTITRADGFFGDPDIHQLAEVLAIAFGGDFRVADAVIAAVHDVTATRPGLQARGWAAAVRAFVLLPRGRLVDAARFAAEAESTWREVQLPRLSRWATIASAQAAVEQGRLDAARAALARLDAVPAERFRLFEPLACRAAGLVDVVAGSGERGVATLRAAFHDALDSGRVTMAVLIAHDLTRVGALAASTESFTAVPTGGAFTEACRAYAEAAGAGRVDRLVAAAESFGALGADLYEAEAYARAGSVAERAGRNREARRLAAQAEVAGELCQGVHPLSATTESGRPAGLSRREQEVVRLAADGRTNRAIADELVISERTVENHLYRAFGKLGVTTRADLAGAVAAERAIE